MKELTCLGVLLLISSSVVGCGEDAHAGSGPAIRAEATATFSNGSTRTTSTHKCGGGEGRSTSSAYACATNTVKPEQSVSGSGWPSHPPMPCTSPPTARASAPPRSPCDR
ncbi:MAG: hypothetical protein U0271_42235 [Polyangiaceae bacterium]